MDDHNRNPTGKGGFQERKHQINRLGRPKEFKDFRKLCQAILSEPARGSNGQPIVIDGHHVATNIEMVVRAAIKDSKYAPLILKYAYGDVPIEIRDWREAAKQAGIDNPDEVVNGLAEFIASKMATRNGAGSDRDGGETEERAEVDASPIADSTAG